jgi:hypothetical protein
MAEESLAELEAAFEEWRRAKRHPREAIPAELLRSARAVARREGPAAVWRATKVDRSRLAVEGRVQTRSRGRGVSVPGFTRLTLPALAPVPPFAEVEVPTGVKVRLFAPTPEAFGLLNTLLGVGGAQ